MLKRLSALALLASVVACSGTTATKPPLSRPVLGGTEGAPLPGIEVHAFDERPRLTVIAREGDPAPAIAAAFATDLGPSATAALSALVEARIQAAGFSGTRVHVDRSGFRIDWSVEDPARVELFLTTLARAVRDPVAPSGPEMALITRRLASLQKAPLDAPELAPIAACTGQLGLGPGDAILDPKSPKFAEELEAHRRVALHAGRASLSAVGPSSFGSDVAKALEKSDEWPAGEPAADPFPSADAITSYVAPLPKGRAGRVTIAVRLGDALSAVAAAERLASPRSALRGRVATESFRVAEIVGVARPRGGCVSVSLEPDVALDVAAFERAAARAAAVARHEIGLESAAPASPAIATRQILSATDPRDAASRAAWWDLSTTVANVEPRAAIALGVPPKFMGPPTNSPGKTFAAEVDRASRALAEPVVDRVYSVERGQGELWLLVASPCGVIDEGASDAGTTALALLAAAAGHDPSDGVTLEPWMGPDGVGFVAHAPVRDERETPADLARRVADAAARALSPASLSGLALTDARASALEHIERAQGRSGLAFEALLLSLAPDHPSWIDPLGTYTRVAGANLDAVRLRLRALYEGPLRLAVLPNADPTQAADAATAIDRWLAPRFATHTCPSPERSAPRPPAPGIRLPRDTSLGQAVLGAPVPAVSAPGHDLALFLALALGGDGGLLESTFPSASGVRASARVLGTRGAAALVIDVRAPADLLGTATNDVRALLGRLSRQGLTPEEFSRAVNLAARRDADARVDPRRRLMQVWSGHAASPRETPTPQALSTFLASTLADSSIVAVEALPEN